MLGQDVVGQLLGFHSDSADIKFIETQSSSAVNRDG